MVITKYNKCFSHCVVYIFIMSRACTGKAVAMSSVCSV